MTREEIEAALSELGGWTVFSNKMVVDFAIQQVNAALEEAAKVVACRVVTGRVWNERQRTEADCVQGCADAIRALKIKVPA